MGSCGSGSGSGMNPEIRDCPAMQPIHKNITRPLNTEEYSTLLIPLSSLFTLYHPMNENLDLEFTLKEFKLLPSSVNYRIAARTVSVQPKFEKSLLTITLLGDFVFVTDVKLEFSAVASDAMMIQTDPCNFTVIISMKDRDNCTEATNFPFSEDLDLEDPLRVYFGISITLDFPVAGVSLVFFFLFP